MNYKAPPLQSGRTLLFIAGVLGVLHFGEDVLVPIALSVLLSFLLAPLVARIESRGVPRGIAVGLTTAIAFALIGALVYTVAHQFLGLAEDLPSYRDNLLEKIRSVSNRTTSGLERSVETVKEIGEELTKAAPRSSESPNIPQVRVVEPAPSASEVIRSVLGPLIRPASTLAIVIVFVIFMLLQREDLRDRLIRLLGAGEMHATVAALDDAARRVSRYLAMQTLINTIQGTLVAAGLWLIGVPDAVLWGALTIVLRFIPYLGPALAAAGPIAVSVAFFPGWTQPLLAVGWIGTLELISNNLLEPRLYGASIGVSSFALIVAAVFWTWLWGAAGLFLATPLTVCLVVMGKYIPHLAFFDVLLGDQPVLQPHERFYQRLLANDPDEAQELFDRALDERSLVEVADDVVLPALRLTKHDHDRGAIDDARRSAMIEQVDELVDELSVQASEADGDRAGQPLARLRLVCLPAVDRADEVIAALLARALAPRGIDVDVVAAATLKAEMLERVEQLRPDVVCISAAPPAAVAHARYLCKKLRVSSDVPIVVGLWNAQGDLTRARDRLVAAGASQVVSTAMELAAVLEERLQGIRQIQPMAVTPVAA
jgi:predicted PurR-regulated permease PerM/CheY-like chemotaxis protein